MDYAQIYLGKPLAELEYADIERFFSSDQPESDQIEFKSYPPQGQGSLNDSLKGVIQSATAFLNSSGGLIIWGAPVGKVVPGKKEKIFIGDLTKVPLTVEKDALISKVSDKIIPLPIGIRVKLIPGADSQVAVFEVDESPYAPHQTDNCYYMRIDGQSKPAPHHYIEALFKKITFPRLQAHIKLDACAVHGNGFLVNASFWFFNFSPFINEEKFFYRIIVDGGVFTKGVSSSSASISPLYGMDGHEFYSRRREPYIDMPLYHSGPERNAQQLYFSTAELSKLGNKARIIISFGGKAAPMKSCHYILDFNNAKNGRPIVTIEYENELMSDRQREMGKDEFTTLESIGVIKK